MRSLLRWPVVLVACAVASFSALGYGWATQSGYFAFLPDEANSADAAVLVPGERPPPDGSGFYFVSVSVLEANLVQELWARHLVEGADLVPSEQILAPGQSNEQRRELELHAMASSQQVAQVVAERALGRDVDVRRDGALVTDVQSGSPAARAGLRAGSVVVAAQGRRVRSAEDLTEAMGGLEPGDVARIQVRGEATARIRTIRSDDGRAIIGVGVADSVEIGELPVKVRFSVPGVGGPSAGLAFALEIYDSLSGRRLLRGHRVAATGALTLDGEVGGVGGVEQKTLGAIEAGCDTFLVPEGDNAEEARRAADGRLRVIAVGSFEDALRAVRALPAT